MPSKSIVPKFIEVELNYPYFTDPVTYTFPRLRKADADADERERILGEGKKLTPAQRLSMLVVNVTGWEDFPPKAEDEALTDFRRRVLLFFDTEDFQEFAEDALLYRVSGVYPQPIFRSGQDHSLAVSVSDKSAVGVSVVTLSDVPTT